MKGRAEITSWKDAKGVGRSIRRLGERRISIVKVAGKRCVTVKPRKMEKTTRRGPWVSTDGRHNNFISHAKFSPLAVNTRNFNTANCFAHLHFTRPWFSALRSKRRYFKNNHTANFQPSFNVRSRNVRSSGNCFVQHFFYIGHVLSFLLISFLWAYWFSFPLRFFSFLFFPSFVNENLMELSDYGNCRVLAFRWIRSAASKYSRTDSDHSAKFLRLFPSDVTFIYDLILFLIR